MISPMRWGLRLSLVLAIGAGVHASPTVAQEVNWRDDYKKAREEAVATDRPLFIDLGTENCHWCKQLDLKTFRDPAIIVLLNERFVPLKIDGQKVPALVEAIRVQMYPTLVFATPGGAILSFQEGFVEAPALRQELQRTLLAVFTPEWMNNDFKTATEASEKGDYARAVSLLKDIVEDGKDRPIQAKARRLLKEVEEQAAVRFSRARQLADKGQNTEAMKAMNELVKTFPGTQAAREGSQFLFTLASRSKTE